jgi:hypothetical protein
VATLLAVKTERIVIQIERSSIRQIWNEKEAGTYQRIWKDIIEKPNATLRLGMLQNHPLHGTNTFSSEDLGVALFD